MGTLGGNMVSKHDENAFPDENDDSFTEEIKTEEFIRSLTGSE
jgi:hypothetical protein